MAWNFSSGKPVYLQIAERITRSVLSGEYVAGEQIPSVRQIALDAAVNPNTVQHAFSELEYEGIIIAQGTLGRFVTEDKEVIESCRKKMAENLVKEFIENISQLSVPKEDIVKMIEEVDL
ncbi:MAG: GntR family transcriptional regulator [Ruminococcaceae bacterium]|nr:GntR family transcriptional regulator [Oscillospiraceae bacterium]